MEILLTQRCAERQTSSVTSQRQHDHYCQSDLCAKRRHTELASKSGRARAGERRSAAHCKIDGPLWEHHNLFYTPVEAVVPPLSEWIPGPQSLVVCCVLHPCLFGFVCFFGRVNK